MRNILKITKCKKFSSCLISTNRTKFTAPVTWEKPGIGKTKETQIMYETNVIKSSFFFIHHTLRNLFIYLFIALYQSFKNNKLLHLKSLLAARKMRDGATAFVQNFCHLIMNTLVMLSYVNQTFPDISKVFLLSSPYI